MFKGADKKHFTIQSEHISTSTTLCLQATPSCSAGKKEQQSELINKQQNTKKNPKQPMQQFFSGPLVKKQSLVQHFCNIQTNDPAKLKHMPLKLLKDSGLLLELLDLYNVTETTRIIKLQYHRVLAKTKSSLGLPHLQMSRPVLCT